MSEALSDILSKEASLLRQAQRMLREQEEREALAEMLEMEEMDLWLESVLVLEAQVERLELPVQVILHMSADLSAGYRQEPSRLLLRLEMLQEEAVLEAMRELQELEAMQE